MAQDSRKAALKAEIDSNLKRVYDETLKEDVPDRFKDLLAQLRQKEPGHSAAGHSAAGQSASDQTASQRKASGEFDSSGGDPQ